MKTTEKKSTPESKEKGNSKSAVATEKKSTDSSKSSGSAGKTAQKKAK